jgi:RHS repeat-associated protein
MSTTTKYIWDDDNLLAEADGTDTIQTVYTNEPEQYGNLISTRLPVAGTPTTFYHHFDAIGSTRQLTNAVGGTTDTMLYDAWGNVVSRTGTTIIAFLWIAVLEYYFDVETGLVSVRERNYSPIVAKWLSRDPARRFQGKNGYPYTENRPIDQFDPTGRQAITLSGIQMGNDPLNGLKLNPIGVLPALKTGLVNPPTGTMCMGWDIKWGFAPAVEVISDPILVALQCTLEVITDCPKRFVFDKCCCPQTPQIRGCCFYESAGRTDKTPTDRWYSKAMPGPCSQAGTRIETGAFVIFDDENDAIGSSIRGGQDRWMPPGTIDCGGIAIGVAYHRDVGSNPDFWKRLKMVEGSFVSLVNFHNCCCDPMFNLTRISATGMASQTIPNS